MASLASTRSLRVSGARAAPSRRAAVVVKAFSLQEALDSTVKSFLKILSPPSTTMPDNSFPETNFSGKVSHSRGSRPFADGWSSEGAHAAAPAEAMKRDDSEAQGYLDGAVKRLVNNNFTGDGNEPPASNNSGWSGDIHKGASKHEARDGFHSKSL